MKAPPKVGGGKPPHHHKPPPPKPGPGPGPKPPHHKQPRKPKPPPKPKKTHAHKKPRKLSPGSDVACCTAEAVGLLLGWDWRQVLDLYWRTARDPDSGASILATLKASDQPQPAGRSGVKFWSPARVADDGDLHLVPAGHGLILGVELPGPHAIAVTPDGTWWSWGQPFNPAHWPHLTIEETWAVTWPR